MDDILSDTQEPKICGKCGAAAVKNGECGECGSRDEESAKKAVSDFDVDKESEPLS